MPANPPASKSATHERQEYHSRSDIKRKRMHSGPRPYCSAVRAVRYRGEAGRGRVRLASAALWAAMKGRMTTFQCPPTSKSVVA